MANAHIEGVLQQHLPFTVLKLSVHNYIPTTLYSVATALTVYGIETIILSRNFDFLDMVATALTVYGIETLKDIQNKNYLTILCCNSTYRLRY